MVARRQEGGMQQVVQTRVITENKRRWRGGQRFQITFKMPLGPGADEFRQDRITASKLSKDAGLVLTVNDSVGGVGKSSKYWYSFIRCLSAFASAKNLVVVSLSHSGWTVLFDLKICFPYLKGAARNVLVSSVSSLLVDAILFGEFSYHPFTYCTCGEAITEVAHLEVIFISCRELSLLKKFMVQGEDKLKGSAQANLKRNRQRFERKYRSVPIWRRALANWRRALARKSSYFDRSCS